MNFIYRMFFSLYLLTAIANSIAAAQDIDNSGDETKSSEQLISEAKDLLQTSRPIDARNKLQLALQKSPKDYRAYMLLAQYYLVDVSHFKLAYRYILQAEDLFKEQYGNEENIRNPEAAKQHGLILFLRSEAELNLDKYQDSLNTLERFEKLYYAPWVARSKAWVLMKLKRIDDAIAVAKSGLIFNPEEKGIYNVLGILLSMNGQRDISLKAFAKSVISELNEGALGQAATPLNNAGEVYREMFNDNMAETAWIKSLSLNDGCEHILPSLNLTILYTDETRFLQAERVLENFQSCFAKNPERSDAEHKTLLALALGKLKYHIGDIDEGLKLLTEAKERQQWFGKIGTNQNDVEFASTTMLAYALKAKSNSLKDFIAKNLFESLNILLKEFSNNISAFWLLREAREKAINELENFEDLNIRNTDTMVEYPTLGMLLKDFPTISLEKRLSRLEQSDNRKQAIIYYKLYLAENLIEKGNHIRANNILNEIKMEFRPIDRLVKSQVLTDLIIAQNNSFYFWQTPNENQRKENINNREELFSLLPPQLRYFNLKLPVEMIVADSETTNKIKRFLSRRFEEISSSSARYKLEIVARDIGSNNVSVELSLIDKVNHDQISYLKKDLLNNRAELADFINNFIAITFKHRVDPASEPLPSLDLLKDI